MKARTPRGLPPTRSAPIVVVREVPFFLASSALVAALSLSACDDTAGVSDSSGSELRDGAAATTTVGGDPLRKPDPGPDTSPPNTCGWHPGNVTKYDAVGQGTLLFPYEIWNAEQLLSMSSAETDFPEVYIVQCADIDMSTVAGEGATEIFGGTYDGRGFSIQNWDSTTGLFGEVRRGGDYLGIIKDLTMQSARVWGTNCGGAIAREGEGWLEDITLLSSDIRCNAEPFPRTGGIAGTWTGDAFRILVADSAIGADAAWGDAGGVFGTARLGLGRDISVVDSTVHAPNDIGGIAAYGSGWFETLWAEGTTLDADGSSGGGGGGLFGTLSGGRLEDSAVLGLVFENAPKDHLGGAVGWLYASQDRDVTVRRVYATGTIHSPHSGPTGGFAGRVRARDGASVSIEDAYSDFEFDAAATVAGGFAGQFVVDNGGTITTQWTYATGSFVAEPSGPTGSYVGEAMLIDWGTTTITDAFAYVDTTAASQLCVAGQGYDAAEFDNVWNGGSPGFDCTGQPAILETSGVWMLSVPDVYMDFSGPDSAWVFEEGVLPTLEF